MAVPVQLTTNVQNETFGGVTYHIEGELVPALHLELSQTSVYFEHHILLWKDPAVAIELHPIKGAFKRMLAGMPFLLTGARGPGRIAFSRDGAGHVFGLHLEPGTGVDVREHQWLAATETVDYTFTRVRGAANILLGGTGFFIDTFSVPAGKASSGCTVLAMCLKSRSRPARPSTSNRAAGSTRSARCKWKRCCNGCPPAFLPAPANSAGTVSRAREDRPANHVLSHGQRGVGGPGYFLTRPRGRMVLPCNSFRIWARPVYMAEPPQTTPSQPVACLNAAPVSLNFS